MSKPKEDDVRPTGPEIIMRKRIVLFDIDYTLFNTAKFKESGLQTYGRYEEDEDALERLARIADLGIFSQGEVAFQRAKLQRTEIARFFDDPNIHIHLDKLQAIEEVLERYKGRRVFLVDDKLSVLAQVKIFSPEVLTVWINRGVYAKNESQRPGFRPDNTITNLLKLIPIVGA